MSQRIPSRLLPTRAVTEGAGVQVRRAIGNPELRELDPFLLLDHFGSDDPDDYGAGFPEHPHRGFVTFTHMLDGHMEHRDSMGNRGDLRAGGAQWMKAASGVIHAEMPRQTRGRMRGFQLWLNLPAAEKMSAPDYRDFSADDIPEVTDGATRVRVLAGEYGARQGALRDPHTGLLYLEASLPAHGRLEVPLPASHQAFVYVFEGDAAILGHPVPPHHLAVLGAGDSLELDAGADGARLILVAGRPLGEPVERHGPFVMNTRQEIEQALADYRDGRLVRPRA